MKAKNDMMGGCRKIVDALNMEFGELKLEKLPTLIITSKTSPEAPLSHFDLQLINADKPTTPPKTLPITCPANLTVGKLKRTLARYLHCPITYLKLHKGLDVPIPNDMENIHDANLDHPNIEVYLNYGKAIELKNAGAHPPQAIKGPRHIIGDGQTKTVKNKQPNNQMVETIFTNAKQESPNPLNANVNPHPERINYNPKTKEQTTIKTEIITDPIPYQPTATVKVYHPWKLPNATRLIALGATIEDMYNQLSTEWQLTGDQLELYNPRTGTIIIGNDDKRTLWNLGFKPNEEISIDLITKQQTNEAYAPSITTKQNQQNATPKINVTFQVINGNIPIIAIPMDPNATLQDMDKALRKRLKCPDQNTTFKYLYNAQFLHITQNTPLMDIFGYNNPLITVSNVPPAVIQNYLTNQQNQQMNTYQEKEASPINNANSLTPNLINNVQYKQSIVPNGPYETSQTYSMVPQIPPPLQTIFAPKPVTTCPPPLLSLDNIAQAIRKQKNPKTRQRMKRKFATLKRIRAYLAKKRARSMFPSNNPRQPFMRQKTGYTPRKRKKHMTTREKVVSRMERNMRKKTKYKHKTKYNKHINLNDIRKYIIDENVAENNLTSGYGTGYNNGYYNN